MKLYVDLVPSTAWYSNLRNELKSKEWDIIRKNVYRNANYCCEICKGKGDKWPVEAHERWDFNIKTKMQTLIKIEALCPKCHEVTHIGLSSMNGKFEKCLSHMMKVNECSEEKARMEIEEAFANWSKLNNYTWNKLDLSFVRLTYESILSEESKNRIELLKTGNCERQFNSK